VWAGAHAATVAPTRTNSLSDTMRTRTLLLLSVVCGLAILLAGMFLLLRIDGEQAAVEPPLAIGDTATAGDLSVTVIGATERDGVVRIEVTLAGVDDPDVLDSFRLLVPGASLEPLDPAQAGTGGCSAATIDAVDCSLAFGVATVEGEARVLVVRRGEDQHRWAVA
jgi:hypothetical protein